MVILELIHAQKIRPSGKNRIVTVSLTRNSFDVLLSTMLFTTVGRLFGNLSVTLNDSLVAEIFRSRLSFTDATVPITHSSSVVDLTISRASLYRTSAISQA